jgi:DNA-directed RNA polymerase specialized sigma24 family protein
VQHLLRRYDGFWRSEVAEELEGEAYLAFARAVLEWDAGRGVSFPRFLVRRLWGHLRTSVRSALGDYGHEISLEAPGAESGRRFQRRLSAIEGPLATNQHDELVERIVLHDELRSALATLPPKQQFALRKRYTDGWEIERIAGALGNAVNHKRAEAG